jgi:hypothetical protein
MATTTDKPRQRSTELGGTGQSGYTAGRTRDASLEREIQTRHTASRDIDENEDEDEAPKTKLDTDDRWTGRGGPVSRDE